MKPPMRILSWFILVGLMLMLAPVPGAVMGCPDQDCCDGGQPIHDTSGPHEGCDPCCPLCLCCLDRCAADLVVIKSPLPAERPCSTLPIGAATPPVAPPLDILKVPRLHLA